MLNQLEQLVSIQNIVTIDNEDSACSSENKKLVRDLLEVTGQQECSSDNIIIGYNKSTRSVAVYGNIVNTLVEYRKNKCETYSVAIYKPLYNAIEFIRSKIKLSQKQTLPLFT